MILQRIASSTVFLAALAASVPAAAQYEVGVYPGTGDLSLRLELPPSRAPVKLAPRGVAWGLRSQVSDVRCAHRSLPRERDGSWTAPAHCAAVTWRVVPDRVPLEGADASKQRTLVLGPDKWMLLAEPTSLLRPLDAAGSATIRAARASARLTGATEVSPGAFRVPETNAAPEFFVLGKAESSRRRIGPFEVRYIADDERRVKRLELEELHASALRYLARVMSLPPLNTVDAHSLLVVWLGVSKSLGTAGGAAGRRSFIANYVVGAPESAERNAAWTTMTVAHEQFHQLAGMVRGDRHSRPFPTWLSESLAQYYGLRAMSAADKSPAARQVWDEFVDLHRPVAHGLAELNRQYRKGDRSVYGLFYSQGATFWHALDQAIRAATAGRKSLDDCVGNLLRAEAGSDGRLPPSFAAELHRLGGPGVDDVLLTYVGN